jgi:hypothetical protein
MADDIIFSEDGGGSIESKDSASGSASSDGIKYESVDLDSSVGDEIKITYAADYDADEDPTTEEADEDVDLEEKEEEDASEEIKAKKPKDDASKTLLKLIDDEGEERSIPLSSTVLVKIEGKEESVTIKELQENYSGRQAVSRRFNELDKQTKVLKREKADFYEIDVKGFNESTKAVNDRLMSFSTMTPEEVVQTVAKMQGQDPKQMLGQMIKRTVDLINRYRGMTPAQVETEEELRTLRLDKKMETIDRQAKEAAQVKFNTQKEQEARRESVYSYMDQMHVEKSEFLEGIDNVVAMMESGEVTGQLDEFQIVNYVRSVKVTGVLNHALSEVRADPDPKILRRMAASIEAEEKMQERCLTMAEVKVIAKRLAATLTVKTPIAKVKAPIQKEDRDSPSYGLPSFKQRIL